ncbi:MULTISPECIES: pPIWI_RE_Z domain-containing protein [Bradyrhizobium]|uniref:pPIWI_RE_Z domain-containing protein n=1 Tax=Bradyrhizobium TaxID=374 RepID=UPI002714A0CD|nr:hypothetical protein [Bradyrhizobium elkanii]WLA46683.1 hypothetical protein QIH80_33795 [Bradyrhizobium elkanii]WLB83033.1 hypothetical protein QIH83_10940 [Bradyrhizobium elkanii]
MRKPPDDFDHALRVQWVCAALHAFLGKHELAGAPALLSGYRSVLRHPAVARIAQAAFQLRQMGVSLVSDAALRDAITDWSNWEVENRGKGDYVEPPFKIDLDARMSFHLRVRTDDPGYVAMVKALTRPLPDKLWNIPQVDVSRPFRVPMDISGLGEPLVVDATDLDGKLPDTPRRDFVRDRDGGIAISFVEIERIAEELDDIDTASPERIPGNFRARLRDDAGNPIFTLLSPKGGSLSATDQVELSGVKHMIGLPGAGKSTLILLMVVALARRGLRIVLLLPSIEASLNYVAELERYGIEPALVVGQSADSRQRHARKLAERIAAGDDTGGMGRTAPGAELLSVNCALAGFLSDPDPHVQFPHMRPPCRDLRQRRLKKDGSEAHGDSSKLCALASVCGRQKSARDLSDPDHNVWIGHVISTDVQTSPHFANEQIRYFEAIARSADLVIVDEADGAQAALDGHALAELDLTGSAESYEAALLRDLMVPVATGRNQGGNSSVQNYAYASQEFTKLNRAVVSHLLEDRRGPQHLHKFQDTFVTGNTVLAALYEPENDDAQSPFETIRPLWDGLVRRVMAERGGYNATAEDDDENEIVELDGINVAAIARSAGKPEADVDRLLHEIMSGMNRWFGATAVLMREEAAERVNKAFFQLFPPVETLDPETARAYFGFLLEVTAVVFQFLTLIPMQQAMIAEGVHSRRIFGSGVSNDLAKFVPEALVGRLSGIKVYFQQGSKGWTLKLKYVSFASAPRLLLYRLATLLEDEGGKGPAVLLASATSFLHDSPSYHIPVGPHFVLRRENEMGAWNRSEYIFSPVPDPLDPRKNIRLSGAFEDRDRGIKAIIDHYFSGDTPLVSRMREDFDPGRRVALVVNSYDQVRMIKEHVRKNHGPFARRLIGVMDQAEDIPGSELGEWVTASQVEALGARDDWDAVVFPMRAIGRGVNIVYPDGPRKRDAVIGTVVFLMRPHPSIDSLGFTAGLAGRNALDFDMATIDRQGGIDDVIGAWRASRSNSLDLMRRLLRYPVQVGRLGKFLINPFTADIMVDVLQTIGRAMRNGCRTRVIFVDEAWAPMSAKGKPDNRYSSMLVCMRDVLRKCFDDADPVRRETYRLLYEPFLQPLSRCTNLIFPTEKTKK